MVKRRRKMKLMTVEVKTLEYQEVKDAVREKRDEEGDEMYMCL